MSFVFHSQKAFILNYLLFLQIPITFCFGKDNTRQQLFYRVRRGGKLKTNVISTFIVEQSLECSFHCMHTTSCMAFNFQPVKNTLEGNCQITNKTVGKLHGDSGYESNEDNNWILYRRLDTAAASSNQGQCEQNRCQNGAECIATNCNRPDCFRCKCTFKYKGKLCEREKVFSSCKEILDKHSEAKSGVYKIQAETKSNFTKVYCEMTSLGECTEGGWTLMMKINGSQSTFNYSSKYWTNKESYNPEGGLASFDKNETKIALYHSLHFKEMCLGMAVNDKLKFVMLSLNDTVSSLYKLMEDEKYLRTRLGADKWKSLIENSSLQIYECKEGFNLQRVKFCETCSRVRLGMTGDEWPNCKSPDSFIGFGGQGSSTCGTPTPELVSCGNLVRCSDHGDKEIRAFGYIFVR